MLKIAECGVVRVLLSMWPSPSTWEPLHRGVLAEWRGSGDGGGAARGGCERVCKGGLRGGCEGVARRF
eukprot:6129737-Alexandrium_andersonii.AAC.1